MLRNYLLAGLRHFRKNKLYTLINVGGLALGLAVAILISLFVQKEFSYDRWIPGHEQVYRVYRHWLSGSNTVWTPDPIAEAMTSDIPEVIRAGGVTPAGETLVEVGGNKLYVPKVAQADSTFIEVIGLPLSHGEAHNALDAPDALLISERLADIFFKDQNPLGQTVRLNDEYDLKVSGVIAEPQGESHLSYEIYARYDWSSPSWTGNNRATYVELQPASQLAAVERKMNDLIRPYWEREIRASGGDPTAQEFPTWKLQPLQNIHLQAAEFGWIDGSGGDRKYVMILMAIGIIVLIIAVINYINLSTARAVERAREVGVRKVSGALRGQLATQFISEALLQTFIAFVLAFGIAALLLPSFNQIVNRELAFSQANWVILIPALLGLVLLMSLLAGSYPAVVLSSFQPIAVLKGRMRRGGSGNAFRRTLVVTQFALSVALVIGMLFIYKQVNFMMSTDLGFSPEQVMSIRLNNRDSHRKIEQLKPAFEAIPGVIGVTTASRKLGQSLPDWGIDLEGYFDAHSPEVLFVDPDFAEVMDLQMTSGRFLSPEFGSDSLNSYVVNEAFIRDYNIEEALGQRVKFTGDSEFGRIVGVLKDFHYRGLDVPIEPLMIGGLPNRWHAGMRLSTANLPATIEQIQSLWEQVEPVHPMRYSFLDEDFASQYNEYRRFGKAMLYATILAMLVAILGLFGLATYATSTRIKEIGVRKVLGASSQRISRMLILDFVRWVFVAGLIAVPLSWFLVNRWLTDFAFRTEITAIPFIAAIAAALLLATVTVQYRAYRAARRNPVEALRYE